MGASFVVRTKPNVLLKRYSDAVGKTTVVRSDHIVILTAIDSAEASEGREEARRSDFERCVNCLTAKLSIESFLRRATVID